MTVNSLVPAAQYLRMSTDHQQYSLDNQADTIACYAAQHGFQIVKTYSDAARSGLRLKNRAGLQQLLKDAIEGQADFRAVLVYDVSRWGRFQDMDEAAHYEYLCKSSGVPVHYCAEMFVNDNSISGLILKALKRTMAGEYSRELSVKVRAGLFRLASLGFKAGGSAPYGLRRQLLDTAGNPKQILEYGDRKSLANEHVILVPGPAEEIATVQQIFRYFADEHRSPYWIAARLNRDQVPYLRGASWKDGTVRNILQDMHYIGMNVWGRTTEYLSGPSRRLPSSQWAVCQKAFAPIVAEELFVRAQHESANFTIRLSDEQLLDRLRKLLKIHGKLSSKIIEKSRLCPGLSTYNARFGGLLNVYLRLGYDRPEMRSQVMVRQKALLLRNSLIKKLVEAFPGRIVEVQRSRRFRPLLRYRKTGLLISVVLARCSTSKLGFSWLIEVPRSQRRRTTILAFLDEENTSFKSLTVVPRLPMKGLHLRTRLKDDWLRSTEPLAKISDFLTVLDRIRNKG
jgi:DNA invertase Pin-like site-specific DNA recombinase